MTRIAILKRAGLFGLALSTALLAGSFRSAPADVKLPAIFGNHMVLQQKQHDKVWGWAEPGEEVTVKIADQTKTAKADKEGAWSVTLDPLSAGGPHTLTVSGKNTVTFEDVLVGEVWVCAGQSNMQMSVNSSNDGDLESLAAHFPKIRLITVPNFGTQEPQKDFHGRWSACTPETVRNFSAVGFFFGRQLNQTLDVPIGLINNAWGGSAAEAWVKRDLLEKDDTYKSLIRQWVEIEKNNNDQGALRGNFRPGNIYNGVLKPTIGYGIKGAIWYQGESNAGRAEQYRHLFPLMIQSWRDEWGIGNFPFYWVQLADHHAESREPGNSSWAELREAQTMTMSLPNTGQAVIIDLGEAKDIHPRNKQDVAKRLARWALAKDYGFHVPYQSPTYKSMETHDGKVMVTFDHVGGGLRAFDTDEVEGFAIAGDDKTFVRARGKLVGNDKVEVWSDKVSHPVAVRYAWADNPVCNLYGNNGLPATPFRTDGVAPTAQGFESLFNGKDLNGWKLGKDHLDGKSASADDRFAVHDGALECRGGKPIEVIETARAFPGDFVLRLEFRASPKANSGLFVRGKQLQVRDYPSVGPYTTLKHFKNGDWNAIEVKVTGDLARCTCNGELLEEALNVKGEGGIGLQAETNLLEYRRIEIREHR